MKQDIAASNAKEKFPIIAIALVFFTMLPVTMIVPVFKDLIKDRLGGDNLMVSLFMSTAMLGSFLFSPIAGHYSDRLQTRKKFIVVFAFLDSLCFLLLAKSQSLLVLQVVRFLEGACHIFVIGLLLSLLSDRENDPGNVRFFRKGVLLGLSGMFLSLGVGMGSPLGILGRKNPEVPFYAASAIMLAIGLFSLFFLKDYPFVHSSEATWKSWIKAFRRNKLILLPYMYTFIDRFTVGFLVTTFNLHMRENLQFQAGKVGMFLSFVLIPMSLLSYPFALLSRKIGTLPLMMAGSLCYGICLAIAGSTQEADTLAFLFLLCGFGAGVMFVPSMILASELSPPGYNASVMAGFTGAGSVGFMLGPIVSVVLQRYLVQLGQQENSFSIVSACMGFSEILVVLISIPIYKKVTRSQL
ncbi:MAG: MFS transporter [Spirochaetota bacterium]